MDPTPLNAVQAAVPDVADDTAGTAVAAPVAEIAGAVADARAALADAAADSAIAATDVAATVDSASNLYRRASRVHYHCGFHVPRSVRRFWL